jgi:ABC-2 type transport system permease protein
MSAPDLTLPAADGRPATSGRARPAYRQFPTAAQFAVRDQIRNRLAGLLLIIFVPIWYLLLLAMAGHKPLQFKLFSTGQVISADGGHLTLITAGLNTLTIITGFVVFHSVHAALGFDRRLVFAGYRKSILIASKTLAMALVAVAVAVYTALVLLAFWRPGLAGFWDIAAGYTVIALTYGAFGLLLGVLVKGDLEGFFLIIMGALVDTFLQNPLGNPLANKPILEWFPSFGPMQFAVGGSLGHAVLGGYLALGLIWAAAFTLAALVIFMIRARVRTHAGRR